VVDLPVSGSGGAHPIWGSKCVTGSLTDHSLFFTLPASFSLSRTKLLDNVRLDLIQVTQTRSQLLLLSTTAPFLQKAVGHRCDSFCCVWSRTMKMPRWTSCDMLIYTKQHSPLTLVALWVIALAQILSQDLYAKSRNSHEVQAPSEGSNRNQTRDTKPKSAQNSKTVHSACDD